MKYLYSTSQISKLSLTLRTFSITSLVASLFLTNRIHLSILSMNWMLEEFKRFSELEVIVSTIFMLGATMQDNERSNIVKICNYGV